MTQQACRLFQRLPVMAHGKAIELARILRSHDNPCWFEMLCRQIIIKAIRLMCMINR